MEKYLTKIEREILELLTNGLKNPVIAQTLTISLASLEDHLKEILRKLDASNKTDAVVKAVKLSIIDPQHIIQ